MTRDDEQTVTIATPAFPRGTVYGLGVPEGPPAAPWIYGYAAAGSARNDQDRQTRPSNDVVMIYYEGGEVVEGEERFLRLRPGEGLEESDLFPLGEIRRHLNDTRGAKLFLLDVTHAPSRGPVNLTESARWIKDDSPFGLLRFSWQGPARDPGTGLAGSLRDALQGSITLGEVDQRFASLRGRRPGLIYRSELTPALDAIVVGSP